MKKLFTLVFTCAAFASGAQTFWTEDFGSGCNRGQLATAYNGSNGMWTITSTGTNDNYANTFYVSAANAGTSVNQCAASCMTGNVTNQTLHLSNITIVIPNFVTVGADSGASYFSGGLCGFGYCAATDRRVESPLINCTGQSNIVLSFLYLENGDAANDDATLWYSPDGGTTWSQLDALAKTSTTCGAIGQWTAFSMNLPASANNNANVKIGFRWVNNDDGAGSDPSFSVDDIMLSTPVGISETGHQDISVYSYGNSIVIQSVKTNFESIEVMDMLGSLVKFERVGNTLQLPGVKAGVYFVRVKMDGQTVTRKVYLD